LVINIYYPDKYLAMAKQFKSGLAIGLMAALAVAVPARAADEISNNGLTFDVDTAIEFEFLESHGSYKATFGVIDLNSGDKTPLIKEDKAADSDDRNVNKASDFLGTPGNAVTQPKNAFTFKANTPYAFYLESRTGSGRVASIVYSTNARNVSGGQQAQMDKGFEGLSNQGVKISWDDKATSPGQERTAIDFNDFVVIAGGGCNCSGPAPATNTVPDDPAPPVRRAPRSPRGRG
jgi:hypothetical protein